jgi:tRNA-specific 2-thiouridylase
MIPRANAAEENAWRGDSTEFAPEPGCSARDVADARETASRMGAPHEVIDGLHAFRSQVVEYFLGDYARGLTPNPCVECNARVKIPLLLDRAMALGCEKLATGHYARLDHDPASGRWRILKARDQAKDQSYYLYKLSQETLARLLFPLGEIIKDEVRSEARRFGLAVSEKPESMEICFVAEGKYPDFVRKHRPEAFKPGDLVDPSRKVIGRHDGVVRYTVGQRRGLDLSGGPWFVLDLNPETATVIVGKEADTWCRSFIAADLRWVAWPGLPTSRACRVKVRYRSPEVPCFLEPLEGGKVRVELGEPVRSVAPGQSAVFYDGETVAGGGVIQKEPKIARLDR